MIATAHNAKPGKLAVLASLMLRPGLWDEQARAWSKLIPHDWPGDYLDHWGKLIREKRAEVLDVLKHNPIFDRGDEQCFDRVGVVIVTVCHDFDTPELIVLGAYSAERQEPLTLHVLPLIEQAARERHCATIRFHTMRAGLVSAALSYGFTVSEIIMRKDVSRHGV